MQKKDNLKNIKEIKILMLNALTEDQGLFIKMKDINLDTLNLNSEYTKEEIMNDNFDFPDFNMGDLS